MLLKKIKRCCRHDTSTLAAKKDITALKAGVDKLGIDKWVNALTDLNNLKTKVGDLDVGKLKTIPVDLKKLSVVSKETVKKTVYNKLNTKVNNLENKIPDATTLIHISQYYTYKQSLKKKKWRCR